MIIENGLKVYTADELKEILELHKKWIDDEDGGVRASLVRANLNGASLVRASLDGANLNRASLVRASLDGANLDGANLVGANLNRASLDGASLDGANLNRASLVRASLDGASLDGASLVRANLNGANLDGASLVRANLDGANLDGASLVGALGNLKHLKTIQCEKYFITYTSKIIQIGCQRHTIEEWQSFDDGKIKNMGGGALEWWNKWKPIIFQIIEMSPAEPTGYVEEEK